MTWLERFSVALLLCMMAFALAGEARSDQKTALRVAILGSLVRGEPLPPQLATLLAEPPEREPWCDEISSPERVGWQLERAVRDASLRYAVPRDLIHSVIRQESAYDPRALSPVGAMGLMQLMPLTARSLGVFCPWDPRENILGGTRYLRELHDRFGSWRLALAAYNAGPTAVERDRIPGVTRRYVRRVLKGWRRYRDGA